MYFDVGGYNITAITGSRKAAGTNSVMNYRLQGTNGDSGSRVFPGQTSAMFNSGRYYEHVAHEIRTLFNLLKVEQITSLAIDVYGCNFKYVTLTPG